MTKISNNVTFTPEALQAAPAQAVAEALAAKSKAKPVANTLVDGKTEQQLKDDIMVVKAFKRAGFNDAKPRENVMTYNKWAASGFKVKTGERAIKVRQFRLFHKSQVELVGIPPKDKPLTEAAVAEFEGKQNHKSAAADQTSLPV